MNELTNLTNSISAVQTKLQEQNLHLKELQQEEEGLIEKIRTGLSVDVLDNAQRLLSAKKKKEECLRANQEYRDALAQCRSLLDNVSEISLDEDSFKPSSSKHYPEDLKEEIQSEILKTLVPEDSLTPPSCVSTPYVIDTVERVVNRPADILPKHLRALISRLLQKMSGAKMIDYTGTRRIKITSKGLNHIKAVTEGNTPQFLDTPRNLFDQGI